MTFALSPDRRQSDLLVQAPDRRRRRGWQVLAAYSCVAAASQMLWLTFAAITTDTATHFGVSVSAVGWLSEIFPLLYVLLAIPAGMLLDRRLIGVLNAASLLLAVGGLLRVGDTFAFAITGQLLVAIAQPVLMSAVSKVAAEFLPARHRPLGISLGSAGGFAGMPIALVMGPLFGASALRWLLVTQAGLALVATLWLMSALRGAHGHRSSQPLVSLVAMRALWRDGTIRALSALAFLGFGVFVALSTWLQTLLHPDGVSDEAAGGLLVAMILAGVIGCATLPAWVVRRQAQRRFLLTVVGLGAVGCAALGLASSTWERLAIMLVLGSVLLAALPVILTAAEELTGAALAGSSGAVIWCAGNLGGLVVALIVQGLLDSPTAAFLVMAGIFACGAPVALRITFGGELRVMLAALAPPN